MTEETPELINEDDDDEDLDEPGYNNQEQTGDDKMP